MTTSLLPTPVLRRQNVRKKPLLSGGTFDLYQLSLRPDTMFMGHVLGCWAALGGGEPAYYVLTQNMRPFLIFSPYLQHLTLRDAGLWPSFRQKQGATSRLFELRTYTPLPGQLPALIARFRHYTLPLFARHGITSVAYWLTVPTADEPTKLIYMLSYADETEARQQFGSFRADPRWQRLKAMSECNGPLHERIESVFLIFSN